MWDTFHQMLEKTNLETKTVAWHTGRCRSDQRIAAHGWSIWSLTHLFSSQTRLAGGIKGATNSHSVSFTSPG